MTVAIRARIDEKTRDEAAVVEAARRNELVSAGSVDALMADLNADD